MDTDIYCVMSDVGDGAGTSSDGADGGCTKSPTVDADVVAAKRRRLTCSMESVEEKEEEMDDKNCSTSAGTERNDLYCHRTTGYGYDH